MLVNGFVGPFLSFVGLFFLAILLLVLPWPWVAPMVGNIALCTWFFFVVNMVR